MSTTVQTIIEAGLARSVASDPGKLTTDAELIGVLNRKYQTYFGLIAFAASDRGLASTTVTLAGSPPSGVLPTDVIDIRRVESATGTRIPIIPADEKDRSWHLAPRVYRKGQALVSVAGASDPIAGDILTLYVDDAPTALAALTDTLDSRFPVQCHELLVLELALYSSTKDEGRNPNEMKALQEERTFHLAAFEKLVGSPSGALTSPHGRPAPEKV